MKETDILRMNQKLSLIPKLTVITNQRLVPVEELMWDSTLTGYTIDVKSLFMADVMATETTLSLLSLVLVLVPQNSLVLHPRSQFLAKITKSLTHFPRDFSFFSKSLQHKIKAVIAWKGCAGISNVMQQTLQGILRIQSSYTGMRRDMNFLVRLLPFCDITCRS